MNTDRFLTRVWDKQEKKMIYVGDDCACLIGCERDGFWIWREDGCDCLEASFEEYKDRFIPMMCTGYKGDNKKLIYQEDIIKVDGNYNGWVRFYEQEDCHIVNYIDINGEHDYILLLVLLGNAGKIEIIGNRLEHPELLEQNKCLL